MKKSSELLALPGDNEKLKAAIGDEAAYIVDEKTGTVLADQNADKKYYPASTTKILTTLVALDYVADKMDTRVTVGDELDMLDPESSLAEIEQGESLTWEELFYGMLLPSGCDAALTIAVNVARMAADNQHLSNEEAIKRFAEMMNEKADEMGCKNYNFVNPHGIHDDNHYISAKDMYIIAHETLKNKDIAQIVKTPVYSRQTATLGIYHWQTTNYLIFDSESAALYSDIFENGHNPQYNQDATGVKTGFTIPAGRCLVFSAKADDKKILGVIFNAPSNAVLYTQANNVIESLKNDYQHVAWTDENHQLPSVKVRDNHFSEVNYLKLFTGKAAASTVLKEKASRYSPRVTLNNSLLEKVDDQTYKVLKAIKEGDEIGSLDIEIDGIIYQSFPIYAGDKMRP